MKLRRSVLASARWCRVCWIWPCREPEVGRRQNHKKNYWHCPRRHPLVCPLRPVRPHSGRASPVRQLRLRKLYPTTRTKSAPCPVQLYPEQNVGGEAPYRRRQYALRRKLVRSAPLDLMYPDYPPTPRLPHAPWEATRRCLQLWKQSSRQAGPRSLQSRMHLGSLTMRRAASCRSSSRSAQYLRPVVADVRWRYLSRYRLYQMVRSVKSILPRREEQQPA